MKEVLMDVLEGIAWVVVLLVNILGMYFLLTLTM